MTTDMYGYVSPDEILALESTKTLLSPSYYSEFPDNHEKRLLGEPIPEQNEVKCITKQGVEFWIMRHSLIINWDGEPAVCSVRENIDNRKKSEQQLTTAKLEAETSSHVKSEFMANMSHELRTPLNAIIGFSELLGNHPEQTLSPKQGEYVGHIHDSGEHLLELINDILDISAIEAGKLELNENDVIIAPLVNETVRLLQARADSGGVQISSDIDENLVAIKIDERRLKQIFLNLISNAIKFTPEGGEVSVRGYLNQDYEIYFVVTDNGVGMTKEGIEKAFELFGQADSSLARKYEGTGLGLPLVKQLVETHGGSFKLESELKKGSIATVCFPAERLISAQPEQTNTQLSLS
ncbi:MAG: PAS domain S-box protein [Rhodospirillaceae bacterium]|nr:PAS domain S-box protein [Rhodospirillaceae bacterium]